LKLFLALNQECASVPYIFKATGVNVYSLEEALYHCYNYWKQSADDFTSAEFIHWVSAELGLAYIASKIKALISIESFTERFASFLRLTDFFDDFQMEEIKSGLREWENALEWERLKERADTLNKGGLAYKAYPLYKRALSYGENSALLNNMAICMLKLQRYEEAYDCLERAYALEPSNTNILINFAEAAVISHSFNKAASLLEKLSDIKNTGEVYCLRGELNYEMGDIRNAAACFEKAASVSSDPHYLYRLSDMYIKLRMYDEALAVLEDAGDGDTGFLSKRAEVYAAAGHIPAAIKCIEKALLVSKADADLWISLALYHRLNYASAKAQAAIVTALNIDPYNEKALLENARIYKTLGKTKDYQEILKDILCSFKKKYREPSL